MLRSRIIPCLLVKDRGLVKTVRFANPTYVGDPINAAKIFNEKEVDELIVLDIDATVRKVEPDYAMIEQLAAECRMPFCYGGGIRTVEQAQRIIRLGVEKVAVSSAAIENPTLVSRMAERVGSQSVIAVLDVKKSAKDGSYELFTRNGRQPTGTSPFVCARELERLGIGEIVVNAIDRDGVMGGYDLALAARMREVITVPLTVLGGAGSLNDIGQLIAKQGIVGAAAGSLFVFKGVYRAVLINYPNHAAKAALMGLREVH
jgi:cyclase